MIELALPAGDLQTALIAFRNGADAVYFGMKEFSARKNARNFSFEDLSIIRKYALDNGKKIYITINTLLNDKEIDDAFKLVKEIEFYGCDGIICQDPGLAKLIKTHFPTLPLHGSTQLAVHTAKGVEVLKIAGFERVVLSRELNFEEIKKIREQTEGVELKVFIHGALCFGFSGLCMASFQTCGRSANKGTCAQICRNYFSLEGSDKTEYFFSMKDLKIKEELLMLDEIGIESAKIEGRMKSKEYVASCARYYRSILDGKYSQDAEKKLSTAFLRSETKGFFHYGKNRPYLIDSSYPGHRGLFLGQIEDQNNLIVKLKTNIELKPHDGICIFKENPNGREDLIAFPLIDYKKTGNLYLIKLPSYHEKLKGLKVYKNSDSSYEEKGIKEKLKKFQRPIDITVKIYQDKLEASFDNIKTELPFSCEESDKTDNNFNNISKLFSESGESPYCLGNLNLVNKTAFDHPFLPLSIIKKLKNSFYDKMTDYKIENKKPFEIEDSGTSLLPERNLISTSLPWQTDGIEVNGCTYYTLSPITFDEEGYLKELEDKLRKTQKNRIGLNNISQLDFALEHKEYEYFIDVYLFLTNRYSAVFFKEILKENLIGGYLYPEFQEYEKPWPFTPTPVHDFKLPLFISRACFMHDGLEKSCTGCNKKGKFKIFQNRTEYEVLVDNCITIVK